MRGRHTTATRVSATHDCGEREDEDEGTDRYIDEDEDHDDSESDDRRRGEVGTRRTVMTTTRARLGGSPDFISLVTTFRSFTPVAIEHIDFLYKFYHKRVHKLFAVHNVETMPKKKQ